jgi:DNA mismatch repair protein MSH6
MQSAQLFLDSCDAFRDFFSAISTLDALAGFAAATHPSAAPPGSTFSRPTFAAKAAERSGTGPAPLMRLHGVWSPALLASGVAVIQPNNLQLGGTQAGHGAVPGLMLLTGANTGGKSTLLRATCLVAIMAQV